MLTPLIVTLALFQAAAPPAQVKPGYVQSVTKPDGTFEVRTSAQQLKADGKPDIWLIGAIHVGAKPYYASLQKLLNEQENVFFEGVRNGPKAALPAPGTAPAKPVYEILSDAIGLDFQMNDIKYNREGWKNVDLTWEELEAMNKAGSNGKPTQFDSIKGILDPNSPMAKQLGVILGSATPGMKEAIKLLIVKSVAGGGAAAIINPATEKIILTARNKAIIDALDISFASPKPPKSIGVFYGAMHLNDVEGTLVSKYGYRLGEKRWFVAADADPKKVDAMGQTMLDLFEKQMKAGAKPPAFR